LSNTFYFKEGNINSTHVESKFAQKSIYMENNQIGARMMLTVRLLTIALLTNHLVTTPTNYH